MGDPGSQHPRGPENVAAGIRRALVPTGSNVTVVAEVVAVHAATGSAALVYSGLKGYTVS